VWKAVRRRAEEEIGCAPKSLPREFGVRDIIRLRSGITHRIMNWEPPRIQLPLRPERLDGGKEEAEGKVSAGWVLKKPVIECCACVGQSSATTRCLTCKSPLNFHPQCFCNYISEMGIKNDRLKAIWKEQDCCVDCGNPWPEDVIKLMHNSDETRWSIHPAQTFAALSEEERSSINKFVGGELFSESEIAFALTVMGKFEVNVNKLSTCDLPREMFFIAPDIAHKGRLTAPGRRYATAP
jgi:hypothetical protein